MDLAYCQFLIKFFHSLFHISIHVRQVLLQFEDQSQILVLFPHVVQCLLAVVSCLMNTVLPMRQPSSLALDLTPKFLSNLPMRRRRHP